MCSTETALLRIQNDLLTAVENKKVSALVLLDLSAAFDTIDHDILLYRLEHYFGLSGKALNFFRSYLINRSQSVLIGSSFSDSKLSTTGVPQGSVLGPLLFSMYTTPLSDFLISKGVSFHLYADDTQIYFSFPASELNSSLEYVNKVLFDLHNWFHSNKLSLNPSKTEFLLVGTKQQRLKLQQQNTNLSINSNTIVPSDTVRNLGVLFDQDLSYKKHISKICQVSFLHIRLLRQIRDHLDLNSAILLANALVSSRLDYCNSLFYGLPQATLLRLQRVQNSLARAVVPSTRRRDHITPVLKQLHWLPVARRIEFKIACLTFNLLNNLGPSYLSDLISFVPISNRRSSNKKLLIVPFIKSMSGHRSFSFASPNIWNSLPQAIRECSNKASFRKMLKTHLFPT